MPDGRGSLIDDERARRIAEALRDGACVGDPTFDVFLRGEARRRSWHYWTPVEVAVTAARWLTEAGASRVLDVGSGAGKLCVVGALASPLSFVGIEHRPSLVVDARELASQFGVEGRTSFRHGRLRDVSFTDFDSLYLYNPFGENFFQAGDRFDDTVRLGPGRFALDVEHMERELVRMPPGTRLVTYNGFGGRIDAQYTLTRSELLVHSRLRLWTKEATSSRDGYWVEVDDVADVVFVPTGDAGA